MRPLRLPRRIRNHDTGSLGMNTLEMGLAVGTFTILLGAILAYCVRINTRQSEQAIDIAKLQMQVSPLWNNVQRRISEDLHHPHPRYFEMDKLLEALEDLSITVAERTRLKELLLERSQDMHEDITEKQRQEARLMIQVMDIVLMESNKGD
jgi:hypothetical protein